MEGGGDLWKSNYEDAGVYPRHQHTYGGYRENCPFVFQQAGPLISAKKRLG
jgi:hypothetical protein